MTRLIYPDVKHPYYIVSPPYRRTSAGVRALHLLCHSLNLCGRTAYIVQNSLTVPASPITGPDLLTPYLTDRIARDHHDNGKIPIVVYPETVPGNPLDASCVVRYVLNFPGLIGGDKTYDQDELCFGYSKVLAVAAGQPDNILFIPTVDTRLFKPSDMAVARSGSCYYADKYKKLHAGRPSDLIETGIEITREDQHAQSAEQLAAIFQRSEIFYTYENTALAIEAVLCGCPAVFVPNLYLDKMIASDELGDDGFAWGAEAAEIARARRTVSQGATNYLRKCDSFWGDLENFIRATQSHARGRPSRGPLAPSRFAGDHSDRGRSGLRGMIDAIAKLGRRRSKSGKT